MGMYYKDLYEGIKEFPASITSDISSIHNENDQL
jgi:hypothetical protein